MRTVTPHISCFNNFDTCPTPDGRLTFSSKSSKSTAEIQFARVGREWIAEYRFRFKCGGFHGRKGITLCAQSGGPGGQTGLYLISGKPRKLTPRECARLQGFPDSFQPHPSTFHARKQFGNSVAVPVVAAIAREAGNLLTKQADAR